MQQEDKAARSAAEMYDWLQNLIVAFVVGILLFTFVGRVVRVEGSSMYDTLLDKDYVIASNLFYTPKYGDIVVFYNEYDQKSLVKRVIGLPGQTVEVDPETATVYVDGVALEEDYVYSPTTSRRDLTGPVTVPEGCLFC
ncbi:MAG: signal peptidase I, partial [bacterium]